LWITQSLTNWDVQQHQCHACWCCAAGAPYERKYFALELMALLLQQWLHTDFSNITAGLPVRRAQGSRPSALRSTPAVAKACAEPFLADLLSPGCVETLLGCVLDSWDKMRVAASR
jgi:hypothetical protein